MMDTLTVVLLAGCAVIIGGWYFLWIKPLQKEHTDLQKELTNYKALDAAIEAFNELDINESLSYEHLDHFDKIRHYREVFKPRGHYHYFLRNNQWWYILHRHRRGDYINVFAIPAESVGMYNEPSPKDNYRIFNFKEDIPELLTVEEFKKRHSEYQGFFNYDTQKTKGESKPYL